jgi:small subunit ribosomal protein S6
MKIYELTIILNSSLDDTAVEAEITRLTDQIKSANGEILEVQDLGVKRMTFEIKKQRQGKYMSIYYKGDSGLPRQLDAGMKLNESVLRFLTIVLKPSEYSTSKPEPKPEPKPEKTTEEPETKEEEE